ncbi:hypothetical protein J6590_048792 [Homalodisca vitripennis]|nr:hypothetical protein J6590_048792 [Homalodisca vitripennis]
MIRLFLDKNQNRSEVKSVFQGTKVWSHHGFVSKHFCSYPIIFCSFRALTEVLCLKTMVNTFRRILLELYYKNFYLNHSNKLNEDQKSTFRRYIKQHKDLSTDEVAEGIRVLANFMCLHYGKKVTILIDDYDDIVLQNIFDQHYKPRTKENEQIQITKVIFGFLKNVLAHILQDSYHIERIIMTGIMNLEVRKKYDVSLKNFAFMQNNRFGKYFGFTEEEVVELIFKFGLDRDERLELTEWFDGYFSADRKTKVYNTLSISEFIMSRIGSGFWTETKPFRTLGILPLLDNPNILDRLVLLSNKSEITIYMKEAFTVEDVIVLKRTAENWWDEKTNTDLFFQLLVQMGYLTYSYWDLKRVEDKVPLKIPNEEIRKEFLSFLHEYFDLKAIKRPDILEE